MVRPTAASRSRAGRPPPTIVSWLTDGCALSAVARSGTASAFTGAFAPGSAMMDASCGTELCGETPRVGVITVSESARRLTWGGNNAKYKSTAAGTCNHSDRSRWPRTSLRQLDTAVAKLKAPATQSGASGTARIMAPEPQARRGPLSTLYLEHPARDAVARRLRVAVAAAIAF